MDEKETMYRHGFFFLRISAEPPAPMFSLCQSEQDADFELLRRYKIYIIILCEINAAVSRCSNSDAEALHLLTKK